MGSLTSQSSWQTYDARHAGVANDAVCVAARGETERGLYVESKHHRILCSFRVEGGLSGLDVGGVMIGSVSASVSGWAVSRSRMELGEKRR